MDSIRQTVYLNRELKEKLRYLSYKGKVSQSDIVTEALKNYLKDHLTDNDIKQIMALK